jgi:hypothetical protein
MAIKILRAYNSEHNNIYQGKHSFSVVITENSANYVFEDKNEEKIYDKRIERVLGMLKIEKPNTIDGWTAVVTYNMLSLGFKEEMFSETSTKNDIKKAISSERSLLEERKNLIENKRNTNSLVYSKEARQQMLYNELLIVDKEFSKFVAGEEVEKIPESYKEYIHFLIREAGTEKLNPWLEPWLDGETDVEKLDMSRGIVLDPIFVPEPIQKEEEKND